MVINGADINDGLGLAFQRTRSRFGDVGLDRVRDSMGPLIGALEAWPAEADGRFVRLFVELWAVAAIARLANAEAPLSQLHIRDFLGHCWVYFNSFKHEQAPPCRRRWTRFGFASRNISATSRWRSG